MEKNGSRTAKAGNSVRCPAGPLTGLAASTTGIATGWAPAAGETRTYRLTVEVADDSSLQHSSGSGTLTWLRGSGPVITTPPSPQPTIAAPTAPTTAPTTPLTSAPTASPATPDSLVEADGRQDQASVRRTQAPVHDAASSSNSPEANPARPGGPAGGSTTDAAPALDSWHAAAKKVADAVDVAFELVGATARQPWYVLASLALMWLFLFAADRSEKLDPEPAYLSFPPDDEDGDK